MLMAGAVLAQWQPLEWIVVGGLVVFGFAFAVNSSVHSYLVLAYAGSEKAAEDIGFYYAANAAGRLLGIVLSGALARWRLAEEDQPERPVARGLLGPPGPPRPLRLDAGALAMMPRLPTATLPPSAGLGIARGVGLVEFLRGLFGKLAEVA